ncbi:MAG: hypothetical protein AAF616_06300 [Bacteroidota bacterium]
MKKSFFQYAFHLTLIFAIAALGGTAFIEEVPEKAEKTEKAEEGLYSYFGNKKFGKAVPKFKDFQGQARVTNLTWETNKSLRKPRARDFNIYFIYHTSYLEGAPFSC